jgi:hypothetical protein
VRYRIGLAYLGDSRSIGGGREWTKAETREILRTETATQGIRPMMSEVSGIRWATAPGRRIAQVDARSQAPIRAATRARGIFRMEVRGQARDSLPVVARGRAEAQVQVLIPVEGRGGSGVRGGGRMGVGGLGSTRSALSLRWRKRIALGCGVPSGLLVVRPMTSVSGLSGIPVGAPGLRSRWDGTSRRCSIRITGIRGG